MALLGLVPAAALLACTACQRCPLPRTRQCTPPCLQGEGGRPSNEVPRTYFPLRGGNKVTLYHDAVCTPGPVQGVTLGNGSLYSEGSCWDDIYDAIREAQRCVAAHASPGSDGMTLARSAPSWCVASNRRLHVCGPARFIWITGWSVWDKTRLRRQPDRDETSPTLGELLIEKAKEGVNVLLLVWDDTTNNLGLHEGLMATHDQETFSFFKDTPVHCVLCPRQGGDEDSYLQVCRAVRQRCMSPHVAACKRDARAACPL